MKKFRVPIFTDQYAVNVFIGEREKLIKAAAKYSHNTKEQVEKWFANNGGLTFLTSTPLIIVHKKKDTTITLAHEASHAMDFIHNRIKMNDTSGEFRAHGIAAILRGVQKKC